MLETLIVLLLVLWGLGYWGPYRVHAGNLIHVLLVIAVVGVIVRVIQGRRLL